MPAMDIASGIQSNMRGKGNCWGNPVTEGFLPVLEVELTYIIAVTRKARGEIF